MKGIGIALVLASICLASAAATNDSEVFHSITFPESARVGDVATKTVMVKDLESDGMKEKVVLSTQLGGSQSANTIKIWRGKELVLLLSYSSAGGCAIGRILGNPRCQVAAWDYIWDEKKECHTEAHYYKVDLYDWNKGYLGLITTLTTRRKYSFGGTVVGPYREFVKDVLPRLLALSTVATATRAMKLAKSHVPASISAHVIDTPFYSGAGFCYQIGVSKAKEVVVVDVTFKQDGKALVQVTDR